MGMILYEVVETCKESHKETIINNNRYQREASGINSENSIISIWNGRHEIRIETLTGDKVFSVDVSRSGHILKIISDED